MLACSSREGRILEQQACQAMWQCCMTEDCEGSTARRKLEFPSAEDDPGMLRVSTIGEREGMSSKDASDRESERPAIVGERRSRRDTLVVGCSRPRYLKTSC